MARPGTTHSARPLSDVDPGAPGFPVQLSGDLPAEDGWRFATGRIKTGSDVLAAAGEIRFFVGTYGARPDAREFILRDTASGEVLFARDPGPVENNAEVRLRRVKDPVKSPAQPFRELRLEVSFRGGESLAVWAQVPGAGDEAARRNLLVSSGDQRGIIWGTWMSDVQVAPASRFVMLEAMWDHAVVARLTLVLGLFLMACVFFGRHQVVSLFVGIAAIYAWLVPPFQAPDEPDHFLTLAEDIGGAAGDSMSTGALRLANLGHFESIKFRPAVKFAAEDVNHPDSGGWATHITPTGSHALRSPLAGILWPIAGSAVARLGAADALMTLRWFNVMLLAGAWLVFMGFVPVAFSFVSAMCLLTIPTLPFFGLHWSNHALPLASTVAATGVALRVISGTRARNADYLIWGGLSGLCFVSGVTGIASFAVMAGLAGISLLRDAKNSVAQDLRRGMSFAAGSLAVILSIGSREYLVEFIQRLMRWRTGPFAKIAEVNPYPVIVSVAILGICSLLVAGALRRRISVRFSGTFQFSRVTAWRTLVRFQAGLWILFVFAGLFYSGPFLPGIEGGEIPDVPLIRYAKIAVGAFLFGFGL
ncbi:hypothetical protein EBZ80_25945, partial [bacterium]|nr:hypothetical protein [bacterium]